MTAGDAETNGGALGEVADRMDRAALTATAIEQISERAALSVDDAYRVQELSIARRLSRGERMAGIKMGFTSREKMRQMGIHETIWGRLTDAMEIAGTGTLDPGRYIHPRAEPEIAFRLSRTPEPDEPPASLVTAVAAVAPAIEIIDSRYADFRFNLPDVIADNASSSAYVVGEWQLYEDGVPEVNGLDVKLMVDGSVVEWGSTAAILGDPLAALAAGAQLAAKYGRPLAAGDLVLAGAATAAVPLQAGTLVEAQVDGLGTVHFRVAKEEAA